MNILFQVLIALAVIWILAFRRARMATILSLLTLALLATSWIWAPALLPWSILTLVALFYFIDSLRRQLLSRPIYRFFQKVLPPMSRTEMEALEAGDV